MGQSLAMESDFINVAATCAATRALGPGVRAVVWVQGCAFHCPGCIAPEWIPLKPARLVSPENLAAELLANPQITGITISGGEPMLQADGLSRMLRYASAIRSIDVLCFSGYHLEQLTTTPPGPGVSDLLQQLDVLVDGPYIHKLNDNLGLRGSRNQRIHYLTSRLKAYDLEHQPRSAEVVLQQGQAMLVGVPPARLGDAFNRAIDRANQMQWELLHYERA